MNPEEAMTYLKAHKNELLDYFMSGVDLIPDDPILICMAGASGAGKTETAKLLIKYNFGEDAIVRIDPDEVKEWMNSKCNGDINDYHEASVLGMEKLYDCCLQKKKNCILDGTFSDLEKGINNIERALSPKRSYSVFLVYVYQEPSLAWQFVQSRAKVTGREVTYDVFKNTLIKSIENVLYVKKKWKYYYCSCSTKEFRPFH